jgi:membrane protease YdiL (CAAX protease family)
LTFFPEPSDDSDPTSSPQVPTYVSFDSIQGNLEANEPPQKRQTKWNRIVLAGCWFVILLITSALASAAYLVSLNTEDSGTQTANLLQVNLEVKLGLAGLIFSDIDAKKKSDSEDSDEEDSEDLATTEFSSIKSGTVTERFCRISLIGEEEGPEKAVSAIQKIRQLAEAEGYQYSANEKELESILKRIYAEFENDKYDLKSISHDDRQKVIDELGFAGKLILYPKKTPFENERSDIISSAKFTLYCVTVLGIVILLAGALSFISWVIFIIMANAGNIKSTTPKDTGNGQVYLETFTFWMLAFIVFQVFAGLLLRIGVPSLIASMSIMLSLSVLIWPIIRGINFRQMLDDIGLRFVNPVREIFFGFVCYLMTLPGLILGIVTLGVVMTAISSGHDGSGFEADKTPGHPIINEFASGRIMTIITAIIMAAIIAPLTEEIIFRGLLYRHLRDLSASLRITISILLACAVNSLIFVSIHPQGWVGLFVLMPLSIGFSLAREWRNHLLAPMTMHAINNGSLTLVMLMLTF